MTEADEKPSRHLHRHRQRPIFRAVPADFRWAHDFVLRSLKLWQDRGQKPHLTAEGLDAVARIYESVGLFQRRPPKRKPLAQFSMKRNPALAAALLLLVGACRPRPPETRIVVVTATPAPVAPVAIAVTPTPEPMQSAEFSFPVMEPTAVEAQPSPAALPEIRESAFEPRREPTPESLREQLGQCVTFTTERFSPGFHPPLSVFTHVRAANICSTAFSGRDVWIEVRVSHIEGGKSGVAGRKITRFQGMDKDGRYTVAIPARGTADLVVQIDGLDQSVMYRFETILSSREDERERGD